MILVPEPGKQPARSTRYPIDGCRLLHVALRSPFEKQPALARALASIAEAYDELDWQRCGTTLAGDFVEKVKAFRPTVIFMQLQCRTNIDPSTIEAIRRIVPSCKILNWDGDQHYEPHDAERYWFVELGRAVDCSLVVNTKHPAEYAAMGVNNPGYLQIGVDGDLYRPTEPTKGVPPIVFLGTNYGNIRQYDRRREMCHLLYKTFGKDFAAYGHGWPSQFGRPLLRQDQEAGVYSAAKVAICTSIRNDLPHYTSDRLFRAMGSGAVCAIEWFPGLVDMIPAHPSVDVVWQWAGVDELIETLDNVIAMNDQVEMRNAVANYAAKHCTWKARMPELVWILEQLS